MQKVFNCLLPGGIFKMWLFLNLSYNYIMSKNGLIYYKSRCYYEKSHLVIAIKVNY